MGVKVEESLADLVQVMVVFVVAMMRMTTVAVRFADVVVLGVDIEDKDIAVVVGMRGIWVVLRVIDAIVVVVS